MVVPLEKKLILFALTVFVICLTASVIVTAAQPFNVEIVLPDSYKSVNPGNDVWFTIKLLNLDNLQRVDVTLNYDILDSTGKSIIHNSKTVAIETQASFVADLQLPKNTPPGHYIINVVVSSSLGESSAKAALDVLKPKNDSRFYYIGAGIVALILLILLIVKSKPWIDKLKLKLKIDRIVKAKLKKK